MQRSFYHNRNGNIHSEESREKFLAESKEAEHELTEAITFIEKIKNEDFEHFKTERYGDAYHIKFKKSGQNLYEELVINYGANYKEVEKVL